MASWQGPQSLRKVRDRAGHGGEARILSTFGACPPCPGAWLLAASRAHSDALPSRSHLMFSCLCDTPTSQPGKTEGQGRLCCL